MKISVLMPVYNAGAYLAQAVESVLRQTHHDIELVIIDDCSTDGSAKTIRRFARRDARVRPVYHAKNQGLAATLNEGLALATSAYVARMDQDDESLPGRLAEQAAFLDAHPDVAVVGSWARNMGRTPDLDRLVRLPFTDAEIKSRLPEQNCLYHPSVMFRRQPVLDAGGYRAEFKNAEDYDLWLRLSRRHALANIPRPLLRYRLSVSGMTMGRKWEQLHYCLLAQESHRNPAASMAELVPLVQARLAALNRQEYFDHVALESVIKLRQLGHGEEAERMFALLAHELSPAACERLALPAPAAEPGARADAPSRFLAGKFFPALLTCLLLMPSLAWIVLDEKVWPWDQAWYGEVSVDLWWTLGHAFKDWWPAMISAFGSKAPGVAWLGQFLVPLGASVGSVEFGLLSLQLLAAGATIALLFQIGTRLWRGDRLGGVFLAVLGAGTPLFAGLTHQFIVEPLQVFTTTWIYWIALTGGKKSRLRLLALTLVAAALAMAVKVTSPLYVVLPGLVIIAQFLQNPLGWCTKRPRGRLCDTLLLALGLVVLFPTLTWYLHNEGTIRDFVKLASSSEVALQYGKLPEFWSKWRFWFTAFQQAFLIPWVGWGLLVLAFSALALRWFARAGAKTPVAWSWRRAVIVAATGELALVLFVFTRQINEETRYLLPLLPAFLVIVGAVFALAPRRWLVFSALAVATGGWAWTHCHALGWRPPDGTLSPWLLALDSDRSHKRDARRLVAVTTTPETSQRIHVCGYETPWLNANSLAFYAAKHRLTVGYRCYYTSLGYAVTDATAAWQRLSDLNTVCFISVEAASQETPPHFLNQVARAILAKVENLPEFRRVPFDSPHHVVLYRHSTWLHENR
jgi:hypothetical protein